MERQPPPQRSHDIVRWMVALAVVAVGGWYLWPKSTLPTAQTSQSSVAAAVAQTSVCTANSLSNDVIVSITKRHLWACSGKQQVYQSPVVTGIAYLPADLTPTGTYRVYSKQTNLHLKGSDTTGSWDDPVSYWMPFLHNKYGTYGFHDATWRAASDFGNISPNSANASHGCVELPLATAKWLYSWVNIGTSVTIES